MGGTLGHWAGIGVAATAAVLTKTPRGVDWQQVLATAGIWAGIVGAVAAVVAVVPLTRNGVLWAGRALLMRVGVPYHWYARKFIEKHGTYDNPYLRVREKRDLRTTYVPLSFQSDDGKGVAVATEVLTDLPADRLVIVGDPGSGKSTLLRAYGVGVLESQFTLGRRPRVVPYLVPMRDLASYLDAGKGLADFITEKILNGYGVFKRDRAAEFFIRTLEQEQAIVMLDGLDEVPDDKQSVVLTAVIAFMGDIKPECPTGNAKILLTCRTQNFEMLRENWAAALGTRETLYALAPLRDSEITRYLLTFKNMFKGADGPARFMRSVRESKTLDLLRAPLVLAMAVGLYADRPTMIPSTVSELYRQMIEELLDRHAFRHERRPDESLLRYRRSDKYRFLREFALDAAQRSGNFADFSRADLDCFAADLAPRLDAVDDGNAMVTEVVKHSGLLSEAGHGDLWHFAHRSVQEFLAADELRLRGDGDRILLAQGNDLNWWQAVQFYTAGREARQVDDFLRGLAKRNSELAAHCLQGAKPSDHAAREVLDALEPIIDARLAALAAATRSPRVPVRTAAIERLSDAITHSRALVAAANASAEDLLPLLETIANTNAAEIASLVPHIIKNMPDDPRLVAPLWQCLGADGIEQRPVCGEIVQRLLTMVMEPNAFAELERQDPQDRDFLSPLRPLAYPFDKALSPEHNLATLLAWGEYLGVTPIAGNRFFEARTAGRLRSVQADLRRTIVLPLCPLARIVSGLMLAAAAITSVLVLATRPGLLLHPFGGWTVGLVIGVAIFPAIIVLSHVEIAKSQHSPYHMVDTRESGNAYFWIGNTFMIGEVSEAIDILLFSSMAFLFAIGAIILAPYSLAAYIATGISSQVFFWETAMALFSRGRKYYLYRPNVYVDVYTDPKSRHWLVADARPSL